MIGGRFIYITRIQGLLFIEGCEEAGCIIYWKCHSHHVGILANKSRDVTFSLFILLESRTSACAWCFICICFICSKVHLNTLLTTAGWKDDYCHLRIVRGEDEPSKIWFLCNSIEVLGLGLWSWMYFRPSKGLGLGDGWVWKALLSFAIIRRLGSPLISHCKNNWVIFLTDYIKKCPFPLSKYTGII